MRKLAYQLKNRILNQETKKISTSCTIPNWQFYRIKDARDKLRMALKEAGYNYFVQEGKLEMLALKLLVRKLSPRQKQSHRAIQYNSDHHNYKKVNMIFSEVEDYFVLRSKRSFLRTSVSYMLDIALRLYLHMATRILYLQITRSRLKKKWCNLIERNSIYNEFLYNDSVYGLCFTEKSIWRSNSS